MNIKPWTSLSQKCIMSYMSADHDRVKVSVRGEAPVEVSRDLLASTIQATSRLPKIAGKRPGEATGFQKSSDFLATAGVVDATKMFGDEEAANILK